MKLYLLLLSTLSACLLDQKSHFTRSHVAWFVGTAGQSRDDITAAAKPAPTGPHSCGYTQVVLLSLLHGKHAIELAKKPVERPYALMVSRLSNG
jgi:hypothetical protein